jgi:hypothetical protein
MLCRCCRSSLTETNKIRFVFFWFCYEFLGFFQGAGLSCKETKLKILTTRSLGSQIYPWNSQPYCRQRGELAGGDPRPEEVHTWHGVCDWAYQGVIGGGGSAWGGSGERWWCDHGNAVASAWNPASTDTMQMNKWPCELEWGLERSLEALAGSGS